jgi:hypothetical protein
MALLVLVHRIVAFFTPTKGWKALVAAAKGGNTVWPAPVEGARKMVGSPFEWLLAERVPGTRQGYEYFLEAHCVACGEGVDPVSSGARCCRCAVPLHMTKDCAGVKHSFSAPSCSWCARLVARITEADARE